MRAAEIIERANEQGVRLTLSSSGTVSAIGPAQAISRLLPHIREKKGEIVVALESEYRRERVLAMLRSDHSKRYAIEVVDERADPVVVAIAIRDIASFELAIPLAFYDGMALLQIVEERLQKASGHR